MRKLSQYLQAKQNPYNARLGQLLDQTDATPAERSAIYLALDALALTPIHAKPDTAIYTARQIMATKR